MARLVVDGQAGQQGVAIDAQQIELSHQDQGPSLHGYAPGHRVGMQKTLNLVEDVEDQNGDNRHLQAQPEGHDRGGRHDQQVGDLADHRVAAVRRDGEHGQGGRQQNFLQPGLAGRHATVRAGQQQQCGQHGGHSEAVAAEPLKTQVDKSPTDQHLAQAARHQARQDRGRQDDLGKNLARLFQTAQPRRLGQPPHQPARHGRFERGQQGEHQCGDGRASTDQVQAHGDDQAEGDGHEPGAALEHQDGADQKAGRHPTSGRLGGIVDDEQAQPGRGDIAETEAHSLDERRQPNRRRKFEGGGFGDCGHGRFLIFPAHCRLERDKSG